MKSQQRSCFPQEYIILAAITLLGAALRFYNLGQWSYWVDEYFTWDKLTNYSEPSFSALFNPNQRHVFWVITNLSFDTLGASALSSRLFPCIVGVVTLPLVYFPIKRMFDHRIGLLTTFMLAVSPWHIYNSQIARWYTLLLLCMFFALISFYQFVETSRFRYLSFYLMLFYLGFSLHHTAGFVPMVAAAYVLLLLLMPSFRSTTITRKRLLVILAVHCAFVLAMLPLLVNFLFDWKALEDVFGQWGRDFWIKLVYHITPTIIVAALGGLVPLFGVRDRRGLFLAIYCSLPPVILGAGLLLLGLNVGTRYFLFILPAILMCASYACIYYKEQMRGNAKMFAALFALIMVLPSAQASYMYYSSWHGYRDRLREGMQFVRQSLSEDDRILCPGLPCDRVAQMDKMNLNDKMFIASKGAFNAEGGKRIWALVPGRLPSEPSGFWKWILENTRLVAEFDARVGYDDQSIRVFLYSPAVISK